jgi:hypothetical protein
MCEENKKKTQAVLSAASALATYLEYQNKNLTKTQYFLYQDLLDALKDYDFTKPIDY